MNKLLLKRTVSTLIASAFVAGCGIAAFADKTPPSEDLILLGEDNFPCDAFCSFVSDSSINTDGNAYLSRAEREAVTELDLDELGEDLDDLSGIEYFPNLTTLSAFQTEITSVDLSGNTLLTDVDLRETPLSEIIVGNNPNLKELRLMGTEIDRLDISMCRQLVDAYYFGSLEDNYDGEYICTWETDDGDYVITFPEGVELELLNLNDQIIFEDAALCSSLADPAYDTDEDGILDASEIDNITVLNLVGSGISDLTGIGYLYNVEELYCNRNGMSSLDVSSLKNLKVLNCSNNSNLTALDLSGLNNLTTLLCYTTRISSLDLSDATELIHLDCCGCSLTSLDLSGLEDLKFLDCGFQNISSLNISDCSNLKTLYCADIDVTELDLSNNTLLEALYCYSSDGFTELNLSNNPNLYVLSMNGCSVTKLNISHCPYLLETFLNGTFSDETYSLTAYDSNGESLSCRLSLSSNVEVITITGWVKEDTGWCYINEDGTKTVSNWQKISNKWYHFDADGYMQTGWQKISNKWYYFASSGAMSTGWQKVSNKWYYFNTSGVMQTGWQKISNKWYYFDASGAMLTGWQKIGKSWYYFNGSGAMLNGWQKISNKWYYFNADGAMQTGWQKISGQWYYFKADGAMVTGSLKIGNKTYNFSSSGVCLNP